MKKSIGLLLALTLILALFAGCGGGASPSGTSSSPTASASGTDAAVKPVKIAVAAPMTGDNAEYGKSFLAAAEVMVEKWNAEGGVLGRPIELVAYDDKNSGEEAASIAQKIVSDPDIVGVLGHFASGVSMAAAPVYQENKLVQISNCASHPDYSSIGNYIFRNNTVINEEFKVIVDIIANDLGYTKVGVIAIKTDWGTTAGGIADELISTSPNLTLVAHEDVMETSDDYSPAIAKLEAAGAEVVVAVGMYGLYGPLAKQYKAVNPDIRLVGVSNAYTQQIIELGGDAVEGLFAPVSFYADNPDPEAQAFVASYIGKFGSEPSSLAAQAYDSIGILLTAIQQVGSTDKEAIRDAVNAIEYDGLSGFTTFDEIGDASKIFTKVIIKDGAFIPYEG